MTLEELRREISGVNDEMLALFEKRMALSQQVARVKREAGLPVLDTAREREILASVAARSDPELRSYSTELFSTLMELSRAYQNRLLGTSSPLAEQVRAAAAESTALPGYAEVACQGVEGAYSQIACSNLFRVPEITYFRDFDGVFSAIEDGICSYGVLPVENSTAGSVNKVYDLMMKHRFFIVRSIRLKVEHHLLANPGATMESIRHIYSHEQALSQCAGYLRSLGSRITVHVAENTAVAARMVHESGATDAAALSSRACAELYDLQCLASSVQDQGNNYTRFICISRNLEICPGADRTSVMLVTKHQPGALYNVLGRLYALGVNLVKLESRPLPDRSFEFMFYFDMELPVRDERLVQLLTELEGISDEFHYLGSYFEEL